VVDVCFSSKSGAGRTGYILDPSIRRVRPLLNKTDILTCRAERVLEEWQNITDRAGKVYDSLDKDTQPAYFELVYMLCLMQTNVHKLYMACEYFPGFTQMRLNW
jgi:hypothetical protein